MLFKTHKENVRKLRLSENFLFGGLNICNDWADVELLLLLTNEKERDRKVSVIIAEHPLPKEDGMPVQQDRLMLKS